MANTPNGPYVDANGVLYTGTGISYTPEGNGKYTFNDGIHGPQSGVAVDENFWNGVRAQAAPAQNSPAPTSPTPSTSSSSNGQNGQYVDAQGVVHTGNFNSTYGTEVVYKPAQGGGWIFSDGLHGDVPGVQLPDAISQSLHLDAGSPPPAGMVLTPNGPIPSGTPQNNPTTLPGTGISTLPPQFQALYDQLNQYLQRLQQNGQVLNPNIQLDPEHIAQFLNQATSEIDPYYQGQLKLAKDSLSNTLGYDVSQLNRSEANTERNYNDNLRTLGEQSADQGFAQSGIRKRQEGDLAYNTQDSINQGRSALSYNAGNQARQFAQQYGSAALPSFSMSGAPQVTAGQSGFGRSAGELPLYQLSPEVYNGLTGSQQYQERADIANRQSQLEGAYRTDQGINQARQLTL